MKKIVFYHYHVNGDCYISRIFVKNIIDTTQSLNLEYFYQAHRSFDSYSSDLGIRKTHFNAFSPEELPPNLENMKAYLLNDVLYINTWIGFAREKYNICVFCLENVLRYYNDFIDEINTSYGLSITPISGEYPYLSFDYDKFDSNFINTYVSAMREKYEKIVILYNVSPTTFISICHVNFNKLLDTFSEKYPHYLFVTFLPTQANRENVVSMSDIFRMHDREPPSYFPVHFSYLSIYSDKIITVASGICQFCFCEDNMHVHGKIAMIYDDTADGNPCGCPFCNNYNDDRLLCTKKYDLFVSMCKFTYNYDESVLFSDLEAFISAALVPSSLIET